MRPSRHEYFMMLAVMASKRASCARRQVGCIFVNAESYIVATGYNGPPSGEINCTDEPCEGVKYPSGQGLNHCKAIHAEMNAKEQSRGRWDEVTHIYVTAKPCMECAKRLMINDFPNLKEVFFLDDYPHDQTNYIFARCNVNLVPIRHFLPRNSILLKLADFLNHNLEGYDPKMAKITKVFEAYGGPADAQLISIDERVDRYQCPEPPPEMMSFGPIDGPVSLADQMFKVHLYVKVPFYFVVKGKAVYRSVFVHVDWMHDERGLRSRLLRESHEIGLIHLDRRELR